MLKLFKVSGDSLFPFLKDGNRVVARKIFKNTKIATGDFVVFYKPEYGLMIKQVKRIVQGQSFVQGTDAFSVDSRDFGTVKFCSLRYKVLLSF